MGKFKFLPICIASNKYGFGHLNRSVEFSNFINRNLRMNIKKETKKAVIKNDKGILKQLLT